MAKTNFDAVAVKNAAGTAYVDLTANAKQAAITALTNANGTGDNTLVDVTATFSQTILNNNFRDLSDKINAILTALQNAGIIT